MASLDTGFRTTVGVQQGCLVSPTLLNIVLEKIKCEALNDHECRLITNFRFADDIVVNAEEKEEAGVLVDGRIDFLSTFDTTTTRYKMETGPEKTNLMTNNTNGFQKR